MIDPELWPLPAPADDDIMHEFAAIASNPDLPRDQIGVLDILSDACAVAALRQGYEAKIFRRGHEYMGTTTYAHFTPANFRD